MFPKVLFGLWLIQYVLFFCALHSYPERVMLQTSLISFRSQGYTFLTEYFVGFSGCCF